MSMSHMIILGIIILLVVPPEKLPELAKQVAKFLFELKRGADQVLTDLKKEASFKPEDIIDQNIKNQFQELQKTLTNYNQAPTAPITPSQPVAIHVHQYTSPELEPKPASSEQPATAAPDVPQATIKKSE